MIAKLMRGDEPTFARFDCQAAGQVGDSQESPLRAPGWYIIDLQGNLVKDERFGDQAATQARIDELLRSGL